MLICCIVDWVSETAGARGSIFSAAAAETALQPAEEPLPWQNHMTRPHSRLTAAIALCLLAYLTCETVSAAAPKRVLLLHPSSGANLLSAMKIRAELERQSPEPLEVL